MKPPLCLLALLVSFTILTNCSSVKFYSDPDLKKETGLRYYTLKPYLLVEYKAEEGNTVKTTVVYLPDLANPQYVRAKTGIGRKELKLTFTNSTLESYGVVSESQFPETLDALASILSKSAYATQAFTGKETTGTDVSATYFRLYEIIPSPDGTTLKEIVPGK